MKTIVSAGCVMMVLVLLSGCASSPSVPVEESPAEAVCPELDQIKLPVDATGEEVRAYIRMIMDRPMSQQWEYFDIPKEVDMLVMVGADHVDLLFAEYSEGDTYITMAIVRLAQPRHKALILGNLLRIPYLIWPVCRYGWEADAKADLVAGLTRYDCLPSDWIKAVAGFEDPETYPGLLAYFESCRDPWLTYNAIENLPEINVEASVLKVWENVKESNNYRRRWEVIPVALECGVVDALDAAAEALRSSVIEKGPRMRIYDAVRRFVGPFQTEEHFQEWVKVNREMVYFDPIKKLYVGKTSLQELAPRYSNPGVNIDPKVELQQALDLVILPENPSARDVKSYVAQVRSALGGKRTSETEELRTAKLVALGPENVPALVEETTLLDGYAIPAIIELTQEQHKKVILDNLRRVPSLVRVVVAKGWEADAKPILVEEVRSSAWLPDEWIQAIVGFDDPDTYPDLIGYFVDSSSRRKTYDIIKNIPGIELDEAVSRAWKKAKYGNYSHRHWDMIPIVMERGYPDSLDMAAKSLLDDADITDRYKKLIRDAIRQYVGEFDTDEDFRIWLKANRDTIQFDPECKIFFSRP